MWSLFLRHIGPDSETSEPDVWCGRWRKTKAEATIRFGDGTLQRAELHSFEAHGIGRVYFKRKRGLAIMTSRGGRSGEFAVCVHNGDVDLIVAKIYPVRKPKR
jgi:hypothetical protein